MTLRSALTGWHGLLFVFVLGGVGAVQAQVLTNSGNYLMFVAGSVRDSDDFPTLDEKIGQLSAVIAPVFVGWDFGRGNLGPSASAGQLLPGGNTFFGVAISPPTIDSAYDGIQVTIDVQRSYVKDTADARMSYTYSQGLLELRHFRSLSQTCEGDRCLSAGVTSFASVRDASFAEVWSESHNAELFINGAGGLQSEIGWTGSAEGLRNASWNWTESLAFPKSTLTLDGAFTADFDLSRIPVGQVFTIGYGMSLTANDKGDGLPSSATAYAVDPVSGTTGTDSGFALTFSGVTPVPEPATPLMLLGGLAALAARRALLRRRPEA